MTPRCVRVTMVRGARRFCLAWSAPAPGQEPVPLAPGVRGLVTLAPTKVVIDGKLREWSEAFCTPVHYNHRDLENRAAQFFYMWDDEALYIGLRCLDQKQANPAPLASDCRRRRGRVLPRHPARRRPAGQGLDDRRDPPLLLGLRGGRGQAALGDAAGDRHERHRAEGGRDRGDAATPTSYEVEFKLPWANFPDFTPKLGAVLALDAELCSGDGGERTDRTLRLRLAALGPAARLARQGRAGQGRSTPTTSPTVGPAAFPFWVETPWVQPERAQVQAVVAIPPAFAEIVGEVEVRLHDADGKIVKTLPARIEPFGPPDQGFAPRRRVLVDRRLRPQHLLRHRPGRRADRARP